MNFPRGLAVESCYVVRKPLGKTVDLYLKWTPLQHSDLKVWLHGELPAQSTSASFQKLKSAPANGSVKSFVAATHKSGALQLSKAEAKTLESVTVDGAGPMPANLAASWSDLLSQRAEAFHSGGLATLPPYETSGETIRPADEVARLLKEVPKMRGQFAGLIEATPLGGGKGSLTPLSYWEMFDVEGQAALNLAAVYSRQSADTHQSVDLSYYSTSGYYVHITLTQMWPLTCRRTGEHARLAGRSRFLRRTRHLARRRAHGFQHGDDARNTKIHQPFSRRCREVSVSSMRFRTELKSFMMTIRSAVLCAAAFLDSSRAAWRRVTVLLSKNRKVRDFLGN
jgi:hypothetical protein